MDGAGLLGGCLGGGHGAWDETSLHGFLPIPVPDHLGIVPEDVMCLHRGCTHTSSMSSDCKALIRRCGQASGLTQHAAQVGRRRHGVGGGS